MMYLSKDFSAQCGKRIRVAECSDVKGAFNFITYSGISEVSFATLEAAEVYELADFLTKNRVHVFAWKGRLYTKHEDILALVPTLHSNELPEFNHRLNIFFNS